LRIVAEYDGLTEHGARGALLRREGLYQSHVEKWRRARDRGDLKGGEKPEKSAARSAPSDGRVVLSENRRLRAENEQLKAELDRTRAVLEIVGKAHALLETISGSAERTTPSTR
jgi:transposase-like protein